MRAKLFFQTNVAIAILPLIVCAVYNGFSFGTRIAFGYLFSGIFIWGTYSLNKGSARKAWPKGRFMIILETALPLAVCAAMIIVDKHPFLSPVNLIIVSSTLIISAFYLFKAVIRT